MTGYPNSCCFAISFKIHSYVWDLYLNFHEIPEDLKVVPHACGICISQSRKKTIVNFIIVSFLRLALKFFAVVVR